MELFQSSFVVRLLTQGSSPWRRTLGFGGETPFGVFVRGGWEDSAAVPPKGATSRLEILLSNNDNLLIREGASCVSSVTEPVAV